MHTFTNNWAAQRQCKPHTFSSIASTHMINTQLLHVQNVHTKYGKYFRGFLNSRLLSFARNSRKLMHREYYHVYSIHASNSIFIEVTDRPKKKKSCIGVTRPTLKIPPTLEVFLLLLRNFHKKLRNCHKKL